ncbi:MAG: hypothetical protein AAF409_06295 [Pseudomonadota bacterium]
MTDRSDRFTEDELLSFVHGTASSGLVGRIETAERDDRTLAAELALMRSLKPALELSTGDMNPPGELDWRRLEAEIRRESPASSAPQSQRAGSGRIVMWKAAAAIFAVAAIGQATYLGLSPATTDPGYQTATGGTAEHVLAISFQPEATEAELRALLLAAGARLVDGPGASGLYRVAFETPDAMSEGRQRLETSPIVGMVLDE